MYIKDIRVNDGYSPPFEFDQVEILKGICLQETFLNDITNAIPSGL